jgi:tripartite-type tricarboxylate transporter receptor subunit TctC
MKKNGRFLSVLAVTAFVSMASCGGSEAPPSTAAKAVDFPTKPIEIVVGFAAGGANHMAAENLKPEAQGVFGQPMTVTPKAGAASAIANSYVAAAPADGYTLLNATLSLPISLYTGAVDYKMENFIGIAMYSNVTPCLAIRSNLPINSLEDLKKYVAGHPDTFTWGHSGVAGVPHIAGCLMFFEMDILTKVKDVPFTGTNEAVAQVIGGHIDAVISFPSTIQEHVRAGNMRVLGVSGSEKVEEFPTVATFKEQGYGNVVFTSSRGIFARSDTPKEIVAILEAGFKKIITSEDFKKRAITLGEPPVFMGSQELTELYYNQCKTIKAIVEKLGLGAK